MSYEINEAQTRTIQRLKDILTMEIVNQESEKIKIEQVAYAQGFDNARKWILQNILSKSYKNLGQLRADIQKFVEGKYDKV